MSFVATTRKWPKRRILSSSAIDSNPLVRLYIEGMFSLRLRNQHEQTQLLTKADEVIFMRKQNVPCIRHRFP